MQLAYTIIYVDNVKNTLAFYEKAFGFKARFIHETGDYGELETGNTTLAFSSRQLMASLGKKTLLANPHNPSFEIALTTVDVPTAVAKATRAGAQLISEPDQMPWGQTMAYVADPNGILIELCTPIA